MSKLLEACMRFVDTEPYEIIRISEVRNGGEIETADRAKTSFCQDIYSGAKAFTMTAIGILCDRGALRLDDKITDIFADELPAGMDERWGLATVEMAILHQLGLPGGFLDIDCASVREFGFDFLKYLFTYPLQYTPGEESRYADGSTYLLSRVVSKVAGEKTDAFLWRELLWKLGFQEAAWSVCPMGYPMGATGFHINSRDMVKLPYLYLKNGVWQGERLLSEEWVKTVLTREFVFEWDLTGRWFFKGGMYGQKMMGLPYQDRAVAFQAYGANSDRLARFIASFED